MISANFSAEFLRFRFEYAALVWDCLATCGSNAFRWHARLTALLGLPFLLLLPAAILVVGAHPFGNPYAFGASLILWPFVLEIPGRMLRQAEISGNRHVEDPTHFDFFLFVIFTILALAAALTLLFVNVAKLTNIELGLLWGVALAGGLECARTAVTSILATTEGYPLYGERPLK
jgi:hypothetical protein